MHKRTTDGYRWAQRGRVAELRGLFDYNGIKDTAIVFVANGGTSDRYGDSLRHSFRWQGRSVADLPPGSYMLRLHLNKATAYALSVSR